MERRDQPRTIDYPFRLIQLHVHKAARVKARLRSVPGLPRLSTTRASLRISRTSRWRSFRSNSRLPRVAAWRGRPAAASKRLQDCNDRRLTGAKLFRAFKVAPPCGRFDFRRRRLSVPRYRLPAGSRRAQGGNNLARRSACASVLSQESVLGCCWSARWPAIGPRPRRCVTSRIRRRLPARHGRTAATTCPPRPI
jgi:hypothetical protein